MTKNIIIDSKEDVKIKRVEKNINKDNKTYNWLIYLIGYALVLIIVSKIFPTFELNTSHYGVYAIIAVVIIYILNKTIKPILKILTLPLTILSLGILYPLTNMIILYLTSFILGNNFNIKGFFSAFIVAITISFFNILMEGLFIKPLIKRKRDYYG